jgi:hypothetical protein
MTAKDSKLDKQTVEIAKRLLATPPKPHEDMKVSREEPTKRPAKDRASSAKPPRA